ncbi:MAG: glycerate 2-kinase, partial [Solirubrobacteraceae bacterium]|nr:glycerate 2-kinase [Solirubrobacteraceae bacterium]
RSALTPDAGGVVAIPPPAAPAPSADPVVIVAPDSFKGTLTAGEVAGALGRGLREGGIPRPVLMPIADGGEGTLEVLAAGLGAALRTARVHDPLGREIEAAYALSADGRTAVVEVARAVGLGLVGVGERDAWAASSAGVGELILAAVEDGAREIVVGLGGSATTDGGAGAIAAVSGAGGLGRAHLVVLCDVTTPFELAAEVFAPQKGADPETVRRLTERLERQAGELPRDPRGVAMTGSAGGLAGGLWARFGAHLVPGAAYVLDRVGFDERLVGAAAVITGEGRLDAQTAAGKAAHAVVSRAVAAGVPAHAVVGQNAMSPADWRRMGLASVREAGTPAALGRAGRALAGVVLAESRPVSRERRPPPR